MKCVVKFKDGYICKMELIQIWDKLLMYRTDDAYLLVPYHDVELGRVELEDFMEAQKDAKSIQVPKPKKPTSWAEVKL